MLELSHLSPAETLTRTAPMFHDLRYAFRQLVKAPGFTAVALLTLALGIGANTTIFSLVNSVVLQPLPYPNPGELVLVWNNNTTEKISDDITSWPTFTDWKTQSKTFAEMAGYSPGNANLTGNGEPEQVPITSVGDRFFETFGIAPLRGRWFSDAEQTPGNDNVVIISHGLWQRRFGGDESILGRDIQVNGRPRSVVGIMPPNFAFPARADLYVPIAPSEQLRNARNSFWLPVVGRLKPGVSVEQAQADLTTVNNAIIAANPNQAGYEVNVVSMHGYMVRNVRTALWVLLGAVACVLLIGCANLANLLLARGAARRREIAVRIALGAGRARIVRQLLVESVLLAVVGGAAGILLGIWGVDLVKLVGAAQLPRLDAIRADFVVLGVTAAVAVVCGLGFGLVPAWQAGRTDPHESLKDGGRGASASRSTQLTRATLVVAQASLAVVLLIGAGLLIRSFWKLQQVDTGLHGENLLSVSLSLPRAKYADGPAASAFHTRLLEHVTALPGVQSAGLTTSILMDRLHNSGIFTVEGRPFEPGERRAELPIDSASGSYFATLGVPLVEGRTFNASDVAGGTRVAVINETMARNWWPGQSPIGRRFLFGNPPAPDARDANGQPVTPNWTTVVGVVKDTRRLGADTPVRIESWIPIGQRPARSFQLIVRTALPIDVMARTLRETIWSIDRDLPVQRIERVADILGATTASRRLNLGLLGSFAGLALVLAALGLYGVMAYSVSQRTGEFGVRLALGAAPGALEKLVLGQGAKLVALGLVIGIAVSLALGSVVESLLYGVRARDWLTYAGVVAVLGTAALLASWLPARRAAKVNPMEALRAE